MSANPGPVSVPISPRWQRFLPFLAWIGELRDRHVLRADVVAGVTVALVLVPQSMAYAQLAGLPAYYGLYASFLPPLVGALFGSSRHLATGPVAVVSLLTAAALEPIAASGTPGYIAYAITLSLLIGLFQLALGLLRLGVVVNFLSHPVIIGFTNAAAVIIATSQLDKLFGVRVDKSAYHPETVWNTLSAIAEGIHMPTFAMAVGAFILMLALRRYAPRLPNVLIAVVLCTLVSWLVTFERVQTIGVDQVADDTTQKIVNQVVSLRQEGPALEAAIVRAEQTYLDTRKRYGDDHTRTILARHAVNTLAQGHERRQKSVKSDLESIKKYHFERVAGERGDPDRFYLQGSLPENAVSDGRRWLIRSFDGEQLVMSGGGNVVGAIPQGLPAFSTPRFDFGVMLQLLSSAIAISLIAFMEAISIAKAIAIQTRHRLNANQELIGQGLANIVGSLSQSYPASGSFSRSAVNLSAGAVTGFSSVITSMIVVVTLLWLTPLLYHLPQATLAAVIMLAVVGLINIRAIRHAWAANRQDGIVAVVSFVLTLAFAPHLDKGILAGAGLALVLYLYRTMQPRVAVLARHIDGTLRDAEAFGLKTCAEISMVRFDGSLYFANTGYFEDKVMERAAAKPGLKFVIVVGDGINQIDATGEEMWWHLTERLHHAGIEVLFTGLKKQVIDTLVRTGLHQRLGAEAFFRTEEQALEYAWNKLGGNHEADCPLNVVCPIKT